jgi:predicted nucleic acid-binding protein
MKPRLYLETTIPSYLVARRSRDLRLAADQEATEEWWEQRRHEYELFVSQAVLDEAAAGDPAVAARRLSAIAGLPRLRATPEVDLLAARLLSEQIIPAIAAPDAVHLALAAAHRMDFLLTWNCKHLHNPRLERRIEAACCACGFVCPVICTPAELLEV